MKKITIFLVSVLLVGLTMFAFKPSEPSEEQLVTNTSVELFGPITSVDSITASYKTWSNNALVKGTGTWLIDISKAVADSNAVITLVVEQSAQTAPLRGVTQRWYITDTIAQISGKFGEAPRIYKNAYTHTMDGREVRLKITSLDDITVNGNIDFIFRPD